MALRGTDPESYITEYTSVYEDYHVLFRGWGRALWRKVQRSSRSEGVIDSADGNGRAPLRTREGRVVLSG